MPHLTVSDLEIRMNVRKTSFQNTFDKRTLAAVVTAADDDQFITPGKQRSHIGDVVIDDTGSRCSCPAAEASPAGIDVSGRNDTVVL
jgi:hypothetical protein